MPRYVQIIDVTHVLLNRFVIFLVSFQEDDSQLQAVAAATGKDAFNNFRRAPIVPFAGRMRNTRSLFGQEICNLYMNSNM